MFSFIVIVLFGTKNWRGVGCWRIDQKWIRQEKFILKTTCTKILCCNSFSMCGSSFASHNIWCYFQWILKDCFIIYQNLYFLQGFTISTIGEGKIVRGCQVQSVLHFNKKFSDYLRFFSLLIFSISLSVHYRYMYILVWDSAVLILSLAHTEM